MDRRVDTLFRCWHWEISFLGVYYNLSIWYKLTNKNMIGAVITIGGAIITIVLNIWLIPKYHYLGAAIATFCCYLFMMITSYLLRSKTFPGTLCTKKTDRLHRDGGNNLCAASWLNIDLGQPVVQSCYGTLLLLLFALFVAKVEKKELERIPFIGKFIMKI